MNHAIEPQLFAADKPTPKRLRLLAAILEGPKTSFELERAPVWDHCANSTVSELRKAGIKILTEMVTVSGYRGEAARIARYSVAPESLTKAQHMLGVLA